MIPKSGYRFSEKIMLWQQTRARRRFGQTNPAPGWLQEPPRACKAPCGIKSLDAVGRRGQRGGQVAFLAPSLIFAGTAARLAERPCPSSKAPATRSAPSIRARAFAA